MGNLPPNGYQITVRVEPVPHQVNENAQQEGIRIQPEHFQTHVPMPIPPQMNEEVGANVDLQPQMSDDEFQRLLLEDLRGCKIFSG